MKKLLLSLLICISFLLFSCKDDDDKETNNNIYCWQFKIEKTTRVVDVYIYGYPRIQVSIYELCNLTEAQANDFVKKGTTQTSKVINGIKVEIETTVYKKKI